MGRKKRSYVPELTPTPIMPGQMMPSAGASLEEDPLEQKSKAAGMSKDKQLEKAIQELQKKLEKSEQETKQKVEEAKREAKQEAKQEVEEANREVAEAKKERDLLKTVETKEVIRGLRSDWKNPYVPDSLSALEEHVWQYQRRSMTDYYAKALVFVQSSGMGKSRLADAFGRRCPMINFVLREASSTGFPPSDVEILSFLRQPLPPQISSPKKQRPSTEESTDELSEPKRNWGPVIWNHILAAALLQASFEIFNTWAKDRTSMTLEKLASSRHNEMAPVQSEPNAVGAPNARAVLRVEFCKSVAKRAREIADLLVSNPAWDKVFDNDDFSAIHHNLETRGSVLKGLRNATRRLMKTLQQCQDVDQNDPTLVIVFDEASSLIRKEHSPELHTGLYVALNRILSCLKRYPVWSFFLATESLIRELVRPSNDTRTGDYFKDDSLRQSYKSDTTQKRFPPFVGLQLDVEDRRNMSNRELRKVELRKSLREFSTLNHMALFGRPLWHAYMKVPEEMLNVAKSKLIGGIKEGSYYAGNTDHVFAALSFRLSLDVCLQNPSSISLNRRAVNTFLRVVLSMDQETGVMNTLTPSEPVLARAAMDYLCSDRGAWPGSIGTLVTQLLEPGLVDKGHKGELYARLVLILAHDWIRALNPERPLPFAPTFRVSELLFALYAEDHHESIRRLPKRIRTARMNFTHFLPAYEQLTPEVSAKLCRHLFRRSAALQLSENQETYDLLLPVYYGPENQQFDISHSGVILVQVKNKLAATTVAEIFDEDFKNVGPGPAQPQAKKSNRKPGHKPRKIVFTDMEKPILFLLFDLGVERSENARSPIVQVMESVTESNPKLWAIHSRGHDTTVFGCLKHTETTEQSELFFSAIKVGNSLEDRVSLRNQTCHELSEEFRYVGYDSEWEKDIAGVQEGGTSVAKRRAGSTDKSGSKRQQVS